MNCSLGCAVNWRRSGHISDTSVSTDDERQEVDRNEAQEDSSWHENPTEP